MNVTFNIRDASAGDAPGIARVHVESWRSTYQGLMPAELLAGLSAERRAAYWAEAILKPAPGAFVLVAEAPVNDADTPPEIVGFASAGPSRSDNLPYRAEVYAIYILAAAQRRGIGVAMFRRAVRRLLEGGHESLLVWVLAGNPSRDFYEAMGGVEVASQVIQIGGADLEEIGYGWQDTNVLAQGE